MTQHHPSVSPQTKAAPPPLPDLAEIRVAIATIISNPELKPDSEGTIKVHDALVELLARVKNLAHRKAYAKEAQTFAEKLRKTGELTPPEVSATDILREIAANEKETEQDENRGGLSGGGIEDLIRDPDPWPDPVSGEKLLDELAKTFSRFLVLLDGTADASALWVMFSHTLDAWTHTSMLAVVSPEKECGKTRFLEVLAGLVPRALATSSISPAAIARVVEKYSPTLLVDEADSFAIDNEGLRGILNAGHTRATAYIIKCVGDNHDPRSFCVWGAKAIAMIRKKLSDLPPTWEGRSIVIRMTRKTRKEQVERLTLDSHEGFSQTKSKAIRWALDKLDELKGADPELPDVLGDRERDIWRPLVAIADHVGGKWPARARKAAELFAKHSDNDSMGVLLLTDTRNLFEQKTLIDSPRKRSPTR